MMLTSGYYIITVMILYSFRPDTGRLTLDALKEPEERQWLSGKAKKGFGHGKY
jgi:hypothetical protein